MTSDARPGLWGLIDERTGDGAAEAEEPGFWDRLSDLADPAEYRPRLAPDVELKEFKLRWGNDYAMIANPRELIHYELKPEEVALLRLMDGTRTVKEIVVERFQEEGELALSGVADLVHQLRVGGFLDHPYLDVYETVERAIKPVSTRRETARQFLTTLSVEWKGADRLVRWLYLRGLKVAFSRVFFLGSLAVAVAGLVAFVSVVRSGRFELAGGSVALGLLLLYVLDYFLTFVHELGHALVLVHFGRRVKSAGFMLYFGSPAFFIESADGLMMERRQRMLQAFAGGYGEMLICGLAAITLWVFPQIGIASVLYQFAVLGFLTIFLNFIPLLELDGYFIIADAIQVPDLRARSISFLRHDLWHQLRAGSRFTRQQIGLALYGVVGLVFSIYVLYLSFFFWRKIFGGLVTSLWNGGLLTQILLVGLALFLLGPLIRTAINVLRALGRRLRAGWRVVRFKLETKWRVEAAHLIDSLPIFEDLPVDALDELAGLVKLRTFSRGQPVVRQGDRATAFFVVRRGTLQVVEEDPGVGADRVLRTLGRGEAFGEVGLVRSSPRAATVRALEESEVFEIDKGGFDQLLRDSAHVPEFAPTLQAVAELGDLQCFARLEPDELARLLDHGDWVNAAPGETIVEEGDPGDSFYGIGSGQVDVFEKGMKVRTMGAGSHFGEIALLLDVPRTATVVARTPSRLFKLDREGFDRIVKAAFVKGTLNPVISPDTVWPH
jgi:putative peptide zinc metalloprotease protein